MTDEPIKLRPKKKHPMMCWVPNCRNVGEYTTLSEGGVSVFECVLCEKHMDDAIGAEQ